MYLNSHKAKGLWCLNYLAFKFILYWETDIFSLGTEVAEAGGTLDLRSQNQRRQHSKTPAKNKGKI